MIYIIKFVYMCARWFSRCAYWLVNQCENAALIVRKSISAKQESILRDASKVEADVSIAHVAIEKEAERAKKVASDNARFIADNMREKAKKLDDKYNRAIL